MFKPMASDVSALSSCVANGHQVLHSVSSSPSKIPYGGFSPVRLQTELASRHLRRRAHTRRLIGGQRPRRSSPMALAGKPPFRAVGGVSVDVLQSRGPWLACGLCCPAGSSLTMASSEALGPSRRFMNYPAGLCPDVSGRGSRDSPIYSACPSIRAAFRTPSDRAGLGCGSSAHAAFAISAPARHPNPHASRLARGQCNEAAKFTLCYGPDSCSPSIDEGFYFRAFIP